MFLQGFLPKLKHHVLSRILTALRARAPELQSNALPLSPDDVDSSHVLFKHDRIYHHNIMRVNYTTYDVRREEDVLHHFTCQHNIMVLANGTGNDASHPFAYGRVLGIYHANVIYTGPGMTDYQPIRVEFLWVRWYERISDHSGWKACKLDRLKFCNITDADTFSFVDPSDVLRGCHVIPRFCKGQTHTGGKGVSSCAKDGTDWKEYYINR